MWVSPNHPDRERLAGRGPATAAAPEPSGEVLATFPRRGRGGLEQELRVSLEEYQGHAYISVRLWERNRRGEFWPVKGRGVSVRISEAEGVAIALERAVARAADPARS